MREVLHLKIAVSVVRLRPWIVPHGVV
jgi:hypothetical protein